MPLRKRRRAQHIYYAKLAFCPINQVYKHGFGQAKADIETEKIFCKTESKLDVAIQATIKKKMKEHKTLIKIFTKDYYDYN